ncbi:MAG: hypothetical protein LPJ89_03860, partial [Hymenobacteraceae bacterium]|nr:hypothetical protein [Hymenobacteraceae bacterium]
TNVNNQEKVNSIASNNRKPLVKEKEKKQQSDKPAQTKPQQKPVRRQVFPDNPGEILSTPVQAVAVNDVKPVETTPAASALAGKPIEVIIHRDAEPATPEVMYASAGNAQPDEEDNQPGKLKLVKNIVKQAISLKNGDGVDLEELGFNSNNKIAFETQAAKQKLSKIINL